MVSSSDQGEDAPLDAAAFGALMARLGPFEPASHVAVACSGGADSMALALLAERWARSSGGRVTALTVDHRLRPDSAAEARQVAAWMAARDIPHRILTRPEGPVRGNLQAAARRARYALLSDWCSENRVLHLLLAHHREDQAETVLLRLVRGSGVDGLSAMAAVSETRCVRLLRPLLGVPRARLRRVLEAAGQAHVEDPSNRDSAYARVRLRRAASVLAAEGLSAERLCATAAGVGRARGALEEATAAVLARAVCLFPEGYARLELEPLRAAPDEIVLRALARLVACVGGGVYPPRLERLQRLHHSLAAPGGSPAARTLGGCRVVPQGGRVLVCREPRAAKDIRKASGAFVWDGRFRFRIKSETGFEVRRLGGRGWAALVRSAPALRDTSVPSAVRPSLPAIWDLDGIASVPHFNYTRPGSASDAPSVESVTFAPARPLSAARFAAGAL